MRQLATKIALAVLVLCAIAGAYLYFAERGATVVAAQFPAAKPALELISTKANEALPIDQPRRVEISADQALLADYSQRERHDQYLDWLFFTALSALVPSTKEFNHTTFDLPTVREGYMRPLGNFEYDVTRSRYIGHGDVLALIPASLDANSRKDNLAHIADEQRKNLGKAFDRLVVVEYRLDDDSTTAVLMRRADVPYAEVFSPVYGYFEQDVGSAAALAAFLSRVDDLTASSKTANGLYLGGRKIFSRSPAQVTVEEVATIWQAERKIQTALDAFDARTQAKVDAFNNKWSGRTYNSSYERKQLETQRDDEWDRLKDQIAAERESLKLVNGSGFSLDPAYDYDTLRAQVSDLSGTIKTILKPVSNGGVLAKYRDWGLGAVLAAIERDPGRAISAGIKEHRDLNGLMDAIVGPIQISSPEKTPSKASGRSSLKSLFDIPSVLTGVVTPTIGATASILKGLQDHDLVPLYVAEDKLDHKADSDPAARFLAGVLHFVEEENRFQAARYDGDLKGTKAGMVLFYTDLLAKIWVINFQRNAPTAAIPGFVDGPSVPSSLIYKTENEQLSRGRLWFGKSDLGFQLLPSRNALLFARNATRVYSAGHDPLNPGVETQTSVGLGTPIIWWNDHYEEIAKFEPEYQRLNETMKWSVIVGWLNESHDGGKLGFLANVPVDRSERLPAWAARHPDLRFKDWDKIDFLPVGYKGTSTEAIPILYGTLFPDFGGATRQLAGGVSLAPKDIFEHRVPIAPDFEPTLLRSNIDYGAEGVSGRKITTFDKTVYTFDDTQAKVASIDVKAQPAAKLRGNTAELANSEFERVATRDGDAVRLQTRIDGTPIGDLEIAPTKNGFRLGWQSREVDNAQMIARRMSVAANPGDVLAGNPDVMAIIQMPGKDNFLVQLRGSQRWLRFAADDVPTRELPKDWLMRSADYLTARRDIRVAALDTAKAHDLLGQHAHLVIEKIGNDGKVVLSLADRDTPAGVKLIDVDIGSGTVKVWVDPDTGAVNIAAAGPQLPGDLAAFVRQFRAEDLAAIRDAARSPSVSRVRLGAVSLEQSRITAAAETGNASDAARDIASDPGAALRAVDQQITAELSTNAGILKLNGPQAAIEHLDSLVRFYGPLPELTLRRALLHIDENRWNDAIADLGKADRPARGRAQFFEEINDRLANQNTDLRSRENVYKFAEFADFRDHVLTSHRDLGETVLPEYNGETFDFALRLGKMPDAVGLKSIDTAKVRTGEAVVYRQDTAGLNNLDWNASVDRTIQQVIEGRLGKVIQLPRGDIAHFRPSAIYTPDHGITFQKVHPASASHFHVPASYNACDPSTDNCSSDAANDDSAEPVYLVVAN